MLPFFVKISSVAAIVAIALVPVAAPAQSAAQKKQLSELVKKIGADDPQNVRFKIEKNLNGFSVEKDGNVVSVAAGTPIDLAAGYGYHLRHDRNFSWSWSGSRFPAAQNFSDKKRQQSSEKTPAHKVNSPWKWRYAYNYCALSYTCAFWGKKEWAEEIDRLALNGINRALVQAGLEKVWQLTLAELGYPKEKILSYIPNPAFAAWWNMGNLEGHGGPLTQGQIEREAELGKFIVDRMRNYGIKPVFQGFVGLVPHDFGEYYKEGDVRIVRQGEWCDGFIRPAVLDPTSPAFPKIAATWYKNLKKVYGVRGKFFAGDLFHEGGNSGGINVKDAASAVQKAMQKASPNSVWLLQAWHGNPSAELMSGLEKDKTLVLSLCKNLATGTDDPHAYFGAPWIWCELLNFGGNHGLYGSEKILGDLGKMARSPDGENLVGLGTVSEGLETNPFFYDLFFERLWIPREKIFTDADYAAWIKTFAARRYGNVSPDAEKAWTLLERSVYRPPRAQEGTTESILCARPNRNAQKASTWASGYVYWNGNDVLNALKSLVAAAENTPELTREETFNWDLCDVARQFLSDLARPLLAKMMADFDTGDKAAFARDSATFLDLIVSTDQLLATHPLWRFGRFYEMALAKGKTAAEKKNETRALKMLFTSWGGKPGALNDYAHRQLSGLMKDYYLKRWTYFVDAHKSALDGDRAQLDALDKKIDALMREWQDDPATYSAKPVGNTLAETRAILKKFEPLARELFSAATATNGRPWTIRDGARELSFDVSDDIMAAGKYAATLQWNDGDSALAIKAVRLFEGKKLVAEDVHAGRTGTENSANVYFLNVKKLRESLDSYVLKVEAEGVSSNNSAGVLLLKKVD